MNWSRHRPTSRQAAPRRVALAWLVLLPSAFWPGAASAAEPAPVSLASASARGFQYGFVVPGEFAVEEVANFGAPVTVATLDALGGESSASLPYPGGNAIAYQGLLNVATGVSSPFAYPASVQASSPGTPSGEVKDPSGTYHLMATAEPGRATGLAQFEPRGGESFLSGARATSSVVREGDTTTAVAESVTEGLSLGGGVVEIGVVHSRAAVTYTLGQPAPVPASALAVDGLRVGGMRLGFGPDGFTVLNSPVPVAPGQVAAQMKAVLDPAGIQLHLVQAREVPGGASAGALEIVWRGQFPGGPTGITTLRLGGATAQMIVSKDAAPTPAPAPAAQPAAALGFMVQPPVAVATPLPPALAVRGEGPARAATPVPARAAPADAPAPPHLQPLAVSPRLQPVGHGGGPVAARSVRGRPDAGLLLALAILALGHAVRRAVRPPA